jgi:hypothetical protein
LKKIATAGIVFLISFAGHAQETRDGKTYYAGFKAVKLVDTSRMYKPNTTESDRLHYRPVDLDIWYPSSTKGDTQLTFGDLFEFLEQRANQYQDTIYTGIVEELAQFYAIESGGETDGGTKLLRAQSNSYAGSHPSNKEFPLIIYMAGLNGMGFENFKILERLAERGFIVVSVWSVGRYPGNMTNHKLDMMQQVYDAEFTLDYIKSQKELNANVNSIGVLGCSWGGMSAAVFVERNSIISTFVSLDGTETHYFGESDEDDTYIREIHHSNLINPETTSLAYLYLESGNKLDEYSPTDEYHYYKKLNSDDKYYLRLLDSKHEDFTSIPSTLQATGKSVEIHNQIMEGAILFFEKHLLGIDSFKSYYNKLLLSDNVSTKPFDPGYNNPKNSLIKGEILEAKTGSPLSYVNVGILNKETGTVSNERGRYELYIKPGMENDTIRVSMIGYKAKQFIVKDLLSRAWNNIELENEINKLNEVVITAQGLKTRNLGNKTTSRFIGAGFGYDQLGAEMGIKINVREQPTFVETFNFNISYNRLSARALFRLNIYEIESGKPSKNIMTENIIIPIEAKHTGLISVDLKEYNIELRDDVIATLEWIKSEGENNKGEAIFFSLGIFSSGTFFKRASQGKFKKYSKMGVGMNFDVRY